MIKLTLNPETRPTAHAFDQKQVIIGSGRSDSVDLTLPNENLQSIHVIIQEKDGQFIIINQANDPFVTVNGFSFGKRKLQSDDIILIGNTPIHFTTAVATAVQNPNSELEATLAAKIHSKTFAKSSPFPEPQQELDFEDELKELEELARSMSLENTQQVHAMSDLEMEALIRQAEEMEQPAQQIPSPQKEIAPAPTSAPKPVAEELPPIVKQTKGSLKDYYLSDLDDDKAKNTYRQVSPTYNWNWRLIWGIIGTSLVVLLFIIGLIYLNMSGKHDEEEIKAAQAVADVAMALTSAQIHPIQLQNQNWSDPDFIKNNLISVLGSQYTPAFTVDSHGQLGMGSYLIRIYTSSNLSQFLVIAQPAPSLLQWLLPKASLLIDSKHMELRKVSDLKALNRLLLNPNTLDSTNAVEISRLVTQGELIPLSSLSLKGERLGFHPPKVLGSIRPGAENLVYNAPRYHHFGEDFMKEALSITERPSSSYHDHIDNVELVQIELQRLTTFPNLVLYSSRGLQWAIQAQKALNTFVPNNKLLVAYLKFNSKGSVLSSHLLMDVGPHQEVASGPPIANTVPDKAIENTISLAYRTTHHSKNSFDPNHPLYLGLLAVKSQYDQAFSEFEKDMRELLNTPNRAAIIEFIERMENMLKKGQKNYQNDNEKLTKTISTYEFLDHLQIILKKYDEDQRKNEEEMIKSLVKLYMDNPDMPLSDFLGYIKEAGLENFANNHLALYEKSHAATALPQKHIEEMIVKIKTATSLADLNEFVDKLSKMLNLEKFPNSAKLISYQNDTRNQVVEKLNEFLFSGSKSLPKEEFKEDNRPVLAHIMKASWITDPDEFDYFINEFEIRTNQ